MIYCSDKSCIYLQLFIMVYLYIPAELFKITFRLFIFCYLYYTRKLSLYYIKKAVKTDINILKDSFGQVQLVFSLTTHYISSSSFFYKA